MLGPRCWEVRCFCARAGGVSPVCRLAALIMASGLKSPMVSLSAQWMAMQNPEIGDRYYIFPMLAWFMTLLVLAAGRSRLGLHWVARGVMLCCVVGIVTDWRHVPYAHTGYYEAAKKFDRAAPGTTVVFPENPLSWQFRADETLTCGYSGCACCMVFAILKKQATEW